jgi:hypothetical protein
MLEDGIHCNSKVVRPELLCCFVLLIQGRERKHNKNNGMTNTKQNSVGRIIIVLFILNNSSSSELVGERLACCMYCVLCAQTKEKQKNMLLRKCWNIGKLYANVDCIHLSSTQ